MLEIKARADAVWQQMDKGVSSRTLKSIVNKRNSIGNRKPQTVSNEFFFFAHSQTTFLILLHNEFWKKNPISKQQIQMKLHDLGCGTSLEFKYKYKYMEKPGVQFYL